MTPQEIQSLLARSWENLYITTFYLNVDGSKGSKKDPLITTKFLLKQGKEKMKSLSLSRQARSSLEEDLRKILSYVEFEFDRKGHRGLALFSCQGMGFFKALPLSIPVGNFLTMEKKCYVTPLLLSREQGKDLCLLLIDRSKSKLLEWNNGELVEHSTIFDEVPQRVREGGWYGLQEKRIARHVEDHVHQHFKKVAVTLFEFFKERHFEGLFLGGPKEAVQDFIPHLHTDLQKRLLATLDLPVESPVSSLIQVMREMAERLRLREEEELVKRLKEQFDKGLANCGAKEVLEALAQGQVQSLVIKAGATLQGYACATCEHLSVEKGECPGCGGDLSLQEDILPRILESAISQHAQVVHARLVQLPSAISALLRFSLASVPSRK